jgi:hypothetical protein
LSAIFLYPLLLVILGDERLLGGAFDWGELNWLETLIFVHCFILMLMLWMSVIAHAWDANAPFHYAHAARWTAQRAAAQLRRYAARYMVPFAEVALHSFIAHH